MVCGRDGASARSRRRSSVASSIDGGKVVVAPAIVLTSAATPLAFLGTGAIAQAGVALWGVGTAVQDALLLALISGVIARGRRATAFGLYDLFFGIAWFAGSAVAGMLLDRSIPALGYLLDAPAARRHTVLLVSATRGSRMRAGVCFRLSFRGLGIMGL